MSKKIEMLNEKAKEIRKLTVKTIGGLGVGHIGGAVSICEVLAALYFDVMNVDPENPKMENREPFCIIKRPRRPCSLCHSGVKRLPERGRAGHPEPSWNTSSKPL